MRQAGKRLCIFLAVWVVFLLVTPPAQGATTRVVFAENFGATW